MCPCVRESMCPKSGDKFQGSGKNRLCSQEPHLGSRTVTLQKEEKNETKFDQSHTNHTCELINIEQTVNCYLAKYIQHVDVNFNSSEKL